MNKQSYIENHRVTVRHASSAICDKRCNVGKGRRSQSLPIVAPKERPCVCSTRSHSGDGCCLFELAASMIVRTPLACTRRGLRKTRSDVHKRCERHIETQVITSGCLCLTSWLSSYVHRPYCSWIKRRGPLYFWRHERAHTHHQS